MNPNDLDATYHAKNDQKVQGYMTNITETVEEGKPSIITSVQVETAVFADCHFLQETVENSERVTNSTIEDLYADGVCQSPDNREFAKNHNAIQLKTGKMQSGCRWELIPHDEDGITIREIAIGNTFEAVKAVTKQGSRKRWRIPWNNKTGWRYFEDKDIKAYQLRKQIESLFWRSSINGITLKLPCSNTVFIHVMARPDIGACSNIVCMHIADVCG